MKFSMELSVRGAAAEPEAIVATVQAADRAGFEMIGYTDHPAPSRKWLDSGGHGTFDPFVGLGFLAAVTSRVRLMTYLTVLPYRNPFLLAKSVASVDRLSRGRLTLMCGTGYLRSEFSAVGVPFEERNARFDEAVDVLRAAFGSPEVSYEGDGFTARGVTYDPPPVQLPHPPIWIGGSSKASRRRVARYGAGWAPLMPDETFARTVRSAPMSSMEDLERNLDELRQLVVDEGRDPASISVQVDGVGDVSQPVGPLLQRIAAFGALGVTHLLVRPPRDASTEGVVEAIEQFGQTVIAAVA